MENLLLCMHPLRMAGGAIVELTALCIALFYLAYVKKNDSGRWFLLAGRVIVAIVSIIIVCSIIFGIARMACHSERCEREGGCKMESGGHEGGGMGCMGEGHCCGMGGEGMEGCKMMMGGEGGMGCMKDGKCMMHGEKMMEDDHGDKTNATGGDSMQTRPAGGGGTTTPK